MTTSGGSSDGLASPIDSGRVRALVRSFERVLADRADRADAIESLERTLAGAESRLASALAELRGTQAEASAASQAADQAAREQISAGQAAARQDADRVLASTLGSVDETHSDQIGAVEHQLREAVWLAETLYEANEEKPGDAYKARVGELGDGMKLLKRLDDDLSYILRSRRQRGVAKRTLPESEGTSRSLKDACADASERLTSLARSPIPRLLESANPLLIVVTLAIVGGTVVAWRDGWVLGQSVWIGAAIGAGIGLVLLIGTFLIARQQVGRAYLSIAAALRDGYQGHERELHEAGESRERAETMLIESRDAEIHAAKEKYGPPLRDLKARRATDEAKAHAAKAASIDASQRELEAASGTLESRIGSEAAARQAIERAALAALHAEHDAAIAELRQELASARSAMLSAWAEGMSAARAEHRSIADACESAFPEWDAASAWQAWERPHRAPPAVRFGTFEIDLTQLSGGLPDEDGFDPGGPAVVRLPAMVDLGSSIGPDGAVGSLLLETDASGRAEAIGALRAAMVRGLTTFPPGRARFTIIDPIGLGQSFAGFMHLADHDEALVSDRIWTEARHIEQRLTDLTEHMESVIQKYLRNEFPTIGAYNERAGEVAEPYRFLIVADFPSNFSESSARRLSSILHSGPRCGVFTFLVRDAAQRLPTGISQDDLDTTCVRVTSRRGALRFEDAPRDRAPFELEPAPPEDLVTDLTNRVGQAARDSSRVEVPFGTVTPQDDRIWTGDCAQELRVPIGRAGATKLQDLSLGRGTLQHALIAGKTGSGKSTLLHVLITNLAMWYSPDQVQFYLVDFKKGVEFKSYALHDLPHARAIAIESEREFGLSVLQEVDAELRRRGERYRDLAVQDVAGFRAKVPDEPMPRILLVIDEFQELFTEDDKVAHEANLLLDRLVRQGRAFGIHVLLGSQTLGGAYTLARSTMGQMGIRVALQCSEADSYLILSEDNAAARLLSRPGEAIYNDASGLLEGNTPFQIVWLAERERDAALERVSLKAQAYGFERERPLVVFEGNAPADPSGNAMLRRVIEVAAAPKRRVWLGNAVAIKDPTGIEMERQTGSNLLVVGQREDVIIPMLSVAMLGLAADDPESRFVVVDGSSAPAGRALLRRVCTVIPNHAEIADGSTLGDTFSSAYQELEDRKAGLGGSGAIYIVVAGLHRYRDLRRREDAYGLSAFGDDDGSAAVSPDRALASLIDDGPSLGIHVIAWCDTVTGLHRVVDRRSMRLFAHRVLFQMGQGDSSELIDSVQAARLGEHRAVLFSEDTGAAEKFHPYGRPGEDWLEWVERTLSQRA